MIDTRDRLVEHPLHSGWLGVVIEHPWGLEGVCADVLWIWGPPVKVDGKQRVPNLPPDPIRYPVRDLSSLRLQVETCQSFADREGDIFDLSKFVEEHVEYCDKVSMKFLFSRKAGELASPWEGSLSAGKFTKLLKGAIAKQRGGIRIDDNIVPVDSIWAALSRLSKKYVNGDRIRLLSHDDRHCWEIAKAILYLAHQQNQGKEECQFGKETVRV